MSGVFDQPEQDLVIARDRLGAGAPISVRQPPAQAPVQHLLELPAFGGRGRRGGGGL